MKQAMIFAAGLGTRLRPLTDTKPKALVEVAGRPLLWHTINKLANSGYSHIVINVHHFAQQIVDYLKANDNFGLDIAISDESDRLLDTGGGIRHALPLIDQSEPLLIHNVDILSNADLDAYTNYTPGEAMLVVSNRPSSRCLLFRSQRLRALESPQCSFRSQRLRALESPQCSNAQRRLLLCGWKNIMTGEVKSPYDDLDAAQCDGYAFSGIHIINPSLYPVLQDWPEERFGIIDFYLSICDKHRIVPIIDNQLRLLDVGKPEALQQASAFLDRICPIDSIVPISKP